MALAWDKVSDCLQALGKKKEAQTCGLRAVSCIPENSLMNKVGCMITIIQRNRHSLGDLK